jgi:hypothetical protein
MGRWAYKVGNPLRGGSASNDILKYRSRQGEVINGRGRVKEGS